MVKLKTIIYQLPEFDILRKTLHQKSDIKLRGIYGSLLALIINYGREVHQNPQLVVVADADAAEKLVDDLQNFAPADQIRYFPSDEAVPFDKGIFTPILYSMRMNALTVAVEKTSPIIVTTPAAILKKVPPPETVKKNLLYLEVKEDFDRDLLIDWLVESGYERVHSIDELGQFSARGGIVDVFSFESEAPYRIEFFGDTIESIREFDVLSQLSTNQAEKIRILGKSIREMETATIFDYFKPDSVLFWDKSERCGQRLLEWWEEASSIFENNKTELTISSIDERYLPLDQIESKTKIFKQIRHSHFGKSEKVDLNFSSNPPASFFGNIKLFVEYLQKSLPGKKNKIFLLHDGKKSRERLEEILEAEVGYIPAVQFVDGEVFGGFHLPKHGIEILTEHEIFNRIKMRRRRRRVRISGSLVRNLKSLNFGDYVVHVDYGIGKYQGTKRITVAGIEKDCIKLCYEDNDILYVSLDKLNHIQKYVGEEGYSPKLTRLGSAEWERVKAKTQKSVEKIARELVQLYAARISQNGFAYSTDTLWQKELEASFLYEDTPDQIKTGEEVKRDMESPKPMDRLICGDVGYGKTEIAVRAAFKAVMEGKQVAILVPTTILAQQHFTTFQERVENFPVNVDVISRFRTSREQKVILEKLADGELDIIIGTHRLLSADVQFKDLGLLIVDEEQRFGVKQKEKLKQIKVTVDTISLTATPIPRTPNNRRPIITEITTWDSQLIYKAVMFEIQREGQVFFVHNRVQTIDGVASMLKRLLPNVRIAVAHGQMKERQLEKIMADFYHKKYDVLVSTMIIENGLDIPNCNTIIVNKADQFGLAQLYQLRGRVGRSDHQAYAFLIVPPQERLKESSIKKLYAIEEFGDLGSGLKIAMRDLEIRGAGNLLGHQQSGYINAVGYDLYQKILRETVESIQEEALPEDFVKHRMPAVDASVDIDTEMFLPDDYIPSPSEKVTIYHRLLNLDNIHLIDNLANELRDRFGPLPRPVEKLIAMVKIKKQASQLYIKQVKIHKNKMTLVFDSRATEKESFIEKELPRYIHQKTADLQFIQSKELKAVISLNGETDMDRIDFAKNFLRSL
jgi:transcription-repair coupling factor (superfamily II helicase)